MTLFGASRAVNDTAVGLTESEFDHVVEAQPKWVSPECTFPNTPSQEAIQTAARLRVLLGASGKMVAVTGVTDNDGATQLAGSLGSGLATITDSDVLIVDANARAPRLHEICHVTIKPGLLELLENEVPLGAAVHRLQLSNLYLLPLGQSVGALATLLSKPEGQNVWQALRQRYRYVVVNTGAVATGADGVLLASMSDGVVAAVAAGIRRRHEVQQFQQELQRLRIPLLGLVLTKQV